VHEIDPELEGVQDQAHDDVVTVEFDDLTAEQVDAVNEHPLAAGSAQPVVGLPLWRCGFRVDPSLSTADVAGDVHLWAAHRGIPFRQMVRS